MSAKDDFFDLFRLRSCRGTDATFDPRGHKMDDERVSHQPPSSQLLVVAPGNLAQNSVIVQNASSVVTTGLSELSPGMWRNFPKTVLTESNYLFYNISIGSIRK